MSAIFPSAVATQLQLLTAQNNSMVVLDANAAIGDTSITVDDASALPTSGYLTFVDTDEVIYYTGKTSNTLTGVTRGADGTSAIAHLAGVDLEQRWNADYHNIVTLELVAVEQYLSDRFGITSAIIVPTGHAFTITDGLGVGAAVDSKSILSLSSTTKGFLPPKMTTTQRDAISSPTEGLRIYNTSTHLSNVYDGTAWRSIIVAGTAQIVNADVNASAAIAYSKLALTGSILNADIASGAAIAYSKLALTGAILNADLAGSIAYSKLTLTGSIVNADVASGAAIAYSKLALTGAILNADLAGSIAYSKLTLTGAIVNADVSSSAAIAYSKLALTGAILNADLAGSIAYSKLSLSGSILNADINASAAIALSKLAALGTAKALQSNASTGFIEASSVTNTELGYVSGVTSAIQTQLNTKASNAGDTFTGDIVITNQQGVKFREPTGGGTNVVYLRAGGNMSADYSILLPVAAPTANAQVLTVSDYTTGALQWGTGGGQGGINYLSTNPDAETGTSGWATYADAAGTTPVDGTGGSPSLTITRTTSTPLRGTGMFTLTKGATNRQGDGASYDYTMDVADKASVQQISFDYQVSSAFVAGDSCDVRIFIYDITNAVLITPAPYTIQGGNGIPHKFTSVFQAASNSTSYRLIFHVATTNASAWTMDFDNVKIGPQQSVMGAPVTDWTAFTFTSSNSSFGTIANSKTYWRRVGGNMEIRGQFQAGTTAGVTALLTLPSGYSFDATQFNGSTRQVVGYYGVSNGSTVGLASTDKLGYIIVDSGGPTTIRFSNQSGTLYQQNTDSAVVSSSQYVDVFCSLPILGWSSNCVMSNDTDTRLVAARYTGSDGAATTAQVNFTTKDYDTHGAVTTGASAWKFTAPVSGYYECTVQTDHLNAISLAIYKNGSSFARVIDGTATNNCQQGSITIFLNPGDTIDFRPSGSFTPNSGTAFSWVSIIRQSGPTTIAATESIVASYRSSAAQSIPDSTQTIFNFDTKDYDSHGTVTTGASWKFTAPISGKYRFSGLISTASGSWVATKQWQLNLFKNGASNAGIMALIFAQATFTGRLCFVGSITLSLAAGDTISPRVFHNIGSSLAVDNDPNNCWFNIERVGN